MNDTENKTMRWGISHNVFAMGLVSLFNDIASEMIYPILPLFLTATLGAPVVAVGLIEGFAEAVASVFKVLSGWLSDRMTRRKPFVIAGYTLSTLAKLLFGLSYSWHLVFVARSFDRFGKGIRTAARDALISASSVTTKKGTSFGFHRAMDSLGAVLGPLIALFCLSYFANNLRLIFFVAIIPSVIGVLLLILLVQEVQRPATKKTTVDLQSWYLLGKPFYLFLLVSALFALGNSSDVFMLLRAKELGLSMVLVIVIYICFNIAYAVGSFPAGIISDRIGSKKVLLAGFLLFAVVYGSLGLITSSGLLWLLFPLYGLYMALTDGVGKAYIANLIPNERLGTAYGLYQISVGLCTFAASLIAGIAWTYIHSYVPFLFGSLMALIAAGLFMIV